MNTGLRAAFVGSVRLVAHRLFTQVNRTFVSSSFKMASAECKPIEVGTEGRPVEAKAEVDAEAENEARPEIEKPLPQRPAAVLFDIDGTLTHSDHLHLTVFQELLLELGFPLPEDPDHVQRLDSGVDVISEEFFRLHISGKSNASIVGSMFPSWPKEKGLAFSHRKEAMFREKAKSILTPLAGLHDLIATLQKQKVPVAAVTNAPRVNAEFMLDAIGLTEVFEHCLVIGEECAQAKPHPAPYLRAASILDVDPRDCVVFEDSPSGSTAGVRAGCFVIGVTTSQPADYLRRQGGVHATVSDFCDPRLRVWSQRDAPQQSGTAADGVRATDRESRESE